MEIIFDKKQLNTAINDLADRIAGDIPANIEIAIIGIRSRGEIIAQRLSKILAEKLKKEVPFGTLDITLYRDDINDPHGQSQPVVRSTEIPFDISEKIIFLVDDVLYTGRSIRAAMDALMDIGRPKAIRLTVLIDRGGRELPIQADFLAEKIDAEEKNSINVSLIETDGLDQVVIE